MIAGHLLKLCHFLYDRDGLRAELSFLRDVDKKEVDFLVTADRKPWVAVEAKLSDENESSNLRYFLDKLKIPFAYQVIRKSGIRSLIRGVRVISADRFLGGLI